MANTWHWRDSFSGPVGYASPQHPTSFSSLDNTAAFGNPFSPQLYHQPSLHQAQANQQQGSSSMGASAWSSSSTSSSSLPGIAIPAHQASAAAAAASGRPRTTARKRSRDEMAADDLESSSEPSQASSVATSPDAMTDLLPMPPSSYTEEVSERLRSSSLIEQRSTLEARKSMRLLDPAGAEALAPSRDRSADPSIDDATLTLGIGWSAVPSTPTMIAASRGWAKHIENNFPLQCVRFVWHNRAVPGYLVSAVTAGVGESGMYSPGSPGYYLFNEELTYGQLVAKSWERALDNLRERPMLFDGAPMILPGVKLPLDQPLIDSMVSTTAPPPQPSPLAITTVTLSSLSSEAAEATPAVAAIDIEMAD